jgi:hypothetical protein
MNREYYIDINYEGVQLTLMENGEQYGVVVFPDFCDGISLSLAITLGEDWMA